MVLPCITHFPGRSCQLSLQVSETVDRHYTRQQTLNHSKLKGRQSFGLSSPDGALQNLRSLLSQLPYCAGLNITCEADAKLERP